LNGILGLITEYNPFHNGHLRHLEMSKQLSNCKYSIAVMSGNFVQRGDTSIVNKWIKTEMALKNGVDLVIELPTLYALSSAENFADGAIKILDELGLVDYVSFGSEIGDINPLNEIASLLYKEPKELSQMIAANVKTGLPYAKARELALEKYYGNSKRINNIIDSPNNILGIEYLKSLKKHKSNIVPITIKRDYSDYNSTKEKTGIVSATAIRTMVQNKKNIHYVVPYETYELFDQEKEAGRLIKSLSVFEKEIIYIFRKMSLAEIAALPDVSEGLENRIKAAVSKYSTLDKVIDEIKTKRYPQSRIQRIMLYALLDITEKDIAMSKKVTPYVRVLGFNQNGKRIISTIAKGNPKVELVTSVRKYLDGPANVNLKKMLQKDILASNIYTLGYESQGISNLDFTNKIIELE
jgi:predicted nucleotidyltransferase